MNGDILQASRLAEFLLDGEWTLASLMLKLRSCFTLPPRSRWPRSAATKLLARFPIAPVRGFELAAWLGASSSFDRDLADVRLDALPRPVMRPHIVASAFNVPALCTPGELADWLKLDPRVLDGLAGLPVPERRRHERSRNYNYRWIKKSSGGVRLIESPRSRLKTVQRQLLNGLLDFTAPHPAAHAFLRGRSIRSFLAPHVSRNWVLRLDLADFFASVPATRVIDLYRFLGYPEAVAQLLTRLCVSATPRTILDEEFGSQAGRQDKRLRARLREPHLPQGAPTSPALANLCLYRFDRRLANLADSRRVRYTRYCDDLVFSGGVDTRHDVPDLRRTLLMILADEGLEVRLAKTRLMPAGTRQNVCGLNLNERLNMPRAAFDQLKAVLHRCRSKGLTEGELAEGDRFYQQLRGRISYVESIHPERGRKLRMMLELCRRGSGVADVRPDDSRRAGGEV